MASSIGERPVQYTSTPPPEIALKDAVRIASRWVVQCAKCLNSYVSGGMYIPLVCRTCSSRKTIHPILALQQQGFRDESPELYIYNDRKFKVYRVKGSLESFTKQSKAIREENQKRALGYKLTYRTGKEPHT